jgi:hypothetical protein
MGIGEVKPGFTWEYLILIVVVAFLSGLVGYALKYFLDRMPVDFVTLHRPYLEPLASVESIEGKDLSIRYSIRNIGRLQAENIRVIYITPQMSAMQFNQPQKRDLAPGGTMSLFLVPESLSKLTVNSPALSIELHLLYSAKIAGKRRDFRSRFDFVLESLGIKKGEISYISASHEEGTVSEEQAMKMVAFSSQLDKEEGTILSWIKLPDENGPIGILFDSQTKALFFDPTGKKLTLIRKDAQKSLTYRVPPQKSPWYNIGVTWAPTKISLYLNGEEVGKMP